jgi:arylsulfatase A-like enzyme
MRRHALELTAIGWVLTLCAGAATAQEPDEGSRRRSVLFYLMDTCRGDRVTFDGYERATTPFLAWLAERSVVFEQCYSQAPWTKPSMASMLSSQYPSTTGVYRVQQRLDDAVLTWPEALRASGMTTAGFSANIVMGNTLSNFAQGFDHFVESTAVNRADPIRFASGSAKKLNTHVFGWLDGNEAWPLLLYVHSVDPHEEYEPEPDYLKRFADPARHASFRREWRALLDSRPPIPGLYVTQDNFDRTGVDAASFIEHASNLYDADVLANDDQVKALWDRLQEEGWGEDMILVLASDHGDEFFEHGGTSHGYSLYDEMVRVPLLIYAPGLLPGGARVTTPVRNLDIYPTLCELLGLEVPAGLVGESLVPLVTGSGAGGERPVFSEHREDPVLRRMGQGSGEMVGLRAGRWKLILNRTLPQLTERPPVELYDLDADPAEASNVADRHPEVVERLRGEVEGFMARQWDGGHRAASAEMDPAVLEQLRALGYVGEEEPAPDLWTAIEGGDLEEIRASLAAGADPDQIDPTFGLRPLSIAAMLGSIELAKLFLEHGATIDALNTDGSSPLSGAAFLGRIEALEFLLDEGADPLAKAGDGTTPLDATRLPWDATKYIADLLQVPVDREEVLEGRQACAELLTLITDG